MPQFQKKENSDIKFEIVEHLGVITNGTKGWSKQLNLVSWNDGVPKYDIRDWNEDYTKMGKGITLSKEEFLALANLINIIYSDKEGEK